MNAPYLYCKNCKKAFALPEYHTAHSPAYPCPRCKQAMVWMESEKETLSVSNGNSGGVRTTHADEDLPPFEPRHRGFYQCLKLLGRGGGGRVYQVRDPLLKRAMALKILSPLKMTPRSKRRFFREILVTANLDHPNIMPVYEGGYLRDGSPYLLMKEIKGQTLKDLIVPGEKGERLLSLREYLEIFLQVCHGVEYAHSKGIIHRDLKPSNIAVGDFGEVIVLDWGLAKFWGEQEFSSRDAQCLDDGMEEEDLSVDGAMIGTPAYMSPEQADGRIDQVGPKSDIYSLGVLLYQILTLSLPFEGTLPQILTSLLTLSPLSPRGRSPHLSIPGALEGICLKALAKDPSDRYGTAKDLIEDIQAFLEGKKVSVYEPPWPERVGLFFQSHIPGLLIFLGVILLVALFGYFLALETGKRLQEEEKKVKAQQDKERFYWEKLQAEKKIRKERERILKMEQEKSESLEKLARARQKIIEDQKKKVLENQLEMKAYHYYFLAQIHLQKKLTYHRMKKVILPQLKKALQIYPPLIVARWELIKIYTYLARDGYVKGELLNLVRLIGQSKRNEKLSQLIVQAFLNPQGVLGKKLWDNFDEYRPDTIPSLIWKGIKVLVFMDFRREDSLKLLNEILSQEEGNLWEFSILKANLLDRMQRFPEALEITGNLIAQNPSLTFLRLTHAHLLKKMGKRDRALQVIRRALRIDPSNHEGWFGMALIKIDKENKKILTPELQLVASFEALRYLDKYVELEGEASKIDFARAQTWKRIRRILSLASPHSFGTLEFWRALVKRINSGSTLDLKKEFALSVLLQKGIPPQIYTRYKDYSQGILRTYKIHNPTATLDSEWVEGALGLTPKK